MCVYRFYVVTVLSVLSIKYYTMESILEQHLGQYPNLISHLLHVFPEPDYELIVTVEGRQHTELSFFCVSHPSVKLQSVPSYMKGFTKHTQIRGYNVCFTICINSYTASIEPHLDIKYIVNGVWEKEGTDSFTKPKTIEATFPLDDDDITLERVQTWRTLLHRELDMGRLTKRANRLAI